VAKAVRVRVSPTAPKQKACMTRPGFRLGHSGEHILKMNLEQYLPVLLFILVGIAVGYSAAGSGLCAGPQSPDAAKNSPYECGFEAFEDARMKFDVRYYLVAILFICSTWKSPSFSPGRWRCKESGDRLCGRDDLPGHPGRGLLPTSGKKAPWTGNERAATRTDAMIEGVMKEGFITTSYDSVVNWAKTGSLWPMTFGWPAVRSR
jgi:hypothetical protein